MSNSTFGPSTASVVAAESLMFFSLIAFPGSLCLPKPRRDKPRCMWKRPDATCSSTIALRTMQFSCDVCSRPAFPPHRARTFKTTTPPSTSVELATNKCQNFSINYFPICVLYSHGHDSLNWNQRFVCRRILLRSLGSSCWHRSSDGSNQPTQCHESS